MFDKLRDAFSDAAKSFGEKELHEKDVEDILFELEIALIESDVATEVIDAIKSELKEKMIGTSVKKDEIEIFVKDSLIQYISSLFDTAGTVDIIQRINEKKEKGEPCLVVFLGINGTGKTTTLAKIAYLLQQAKFSVVIAAGDTFRAGAIEQLREHANRLNLKLVAQNYNSDPAAVARDAVLYAKSHKVDCVLIDTAGRMQTSKNLMDQIEKITKVVNPDLKIFVGDSLAGNDTVNQAREFYEHTKFDGSILTKSDADARGGAALSIVKVTSTPVMYVGVGQEYPDLKSFDKEIFLKTVFGSTDDVTLSESQFQPEPVAEPEPDGSDPFVGIDASDIGNYSSLFHLSPPENDEHAKQMAENIHKWIEQGRPLPVAEPTPEPVAESTPEPVAEPILDSNDPFEGIDDSDIENYAQLFEMAPPGSDDFAKQMATRIRKWIDQGRPNPGEIPPVEQNESKPEVTEEKLDESEESEETQENKTDEPESDEKPKKKRRLFGFLKK